MDQKTAMALKAAVIAAVASASFLANGPRRAISSELTGRYGGNAMKACASVSACPTFCAVGARPYIVGGSCHSYTAVGDCHADGGSQPCGTQYNATTDCRVYITGTWTFGC